MRKKYIEEDVQSLFTKLTKLTRDYINFRKYEWAPLKKKVDELTGEPPPPGTVAHAKMQEEQKFLEETIRKAMAESLVKLSGQDPELPSTLIEDIAEAVRNREVDKVQTNEWGELELTLQTELFRNFPSLGARESERLALRIARTLRDKNLVK